MAVPEPAWVLARCTLPAAEQPLRVAEFDTLFATSLRAAHRFTPTRLRLMLDPTSERTARELTARESTCCSLFTFTFRPTGTGLALDIEVPIAQVRVLDGLLAKADILRPPGS